MIVQVDEWSKMTRGTVVHINSVASLLEEKLRLVKAIVIETLDNRKSHLKWQSVSKIYHIWSLN